MTAKNKRGEGKAAKINGTNKRKGDKKAISRRSEFWRGSEKLSKS
jgi:hypothetical protein